MKQNYKWYIIIIIVCVALPFIACKGVYLLAGILEFCEGGIDFPDIDDIKERHSTDGIQDMDDLLCLLEETYDKLNNINDPISKKINQNHVLGKRYCDRSWLYSHGFEENYYSSGCYDVYYKPIADNMYYTNIRYEVFYATVDTEKYKKVRQEWYYLDGCYEPDDLMKKYYDMRNSYTQDKKYNERHSYNGFYDDFRHGEFLVSKFTTSIWINIPVKNQNDRDIIMNWVDTHEKPKGTYIQVVENNYGKYNKSIDIRIICKPLVEVEDMFDKLINCSDKVITGSFPCKVMLESYK